MKSQRPVNLDLTTIKFPVTAIVSITHRISGGISLVGILLLFWMFDRSLRSPESFAELQATLDNPLFAFILWLFLAPLIWHLCLGFRHLIMDVGLWEGLESGQASAKATAAVAAVLIIATLGWVLW